MSAVNGQSSESWLNKLMNRQITQKEASKESHSRMLSGKSIDVQRQAQLRQLTKSFVPFQTKRFSTPCTRIMSVPTQLRTTSKISELSSLLSVVV